MHHDVDLPVGIQRRPHDPVYCADRADIGADQDCLASLCPDLLDRLLAGFLRARRHDHAGAFLGKDYGYCPADTLARTRYDSHFTLQPVVPHCVHLIAMSNVLERVPV